MSVYPAGHYPAVQVGLLSCTGRCVCGWAGPRLWGLGRKTTEAACDDYWEHMCASSEKAGSSCRWS